MSGIGISFKHKGNFDNTTKFFNKLLSKDYRNVLDEYGKLGVELLRIATPKATGKTSESWDYIIEEKQNEISITFINTNVNKGENVAILIQYGHGTRGGGYVVGRDYLNPVLQPLFDALAGDVWEEVTS